MKMEMAVRYCYIVIFVNYKTKFAAKHYNPTLAKLVLWFVLGLYSTVVEIMRHKFAAKHYNSTLVQLVL